MTDKPIKILFITNSFIGDAVLTTGVLDELIRRHPGCEVSVAASPLVLELFKDVPGLKRLIPMNRREFRKRPLPFHWLNLYAHALGTVWDIGVDFRKSAFLYTVFCKRRLIAKTSKNNPERVFIQNSQILGKDQTPLYPTLWASDKTIAKARAKTGEAPYIAIAPTANWDLKAWQEERFIELLKILTAEDGNFKGHKIILLGGRDEVSKAQKIVAAFSPDRLTSLIGQTNLLEAYAVIKGAALFIGNDSGLGHIASATETLGFSLFGPTNADMYGPCGKNSHSVKGRIPHYEVMAGKYDEHPMESVYVEDVLEAINKSFPRT